MRKSILDFRRTKRVVIAPKKSASVNATVTYSIDKDKLIETYGKDYWVQFRKLHGYGPDGTRQNYLKVTLRPNGTGGHFVIIQRYRWEFDQVVNDMAFFTRGGWVRASIPAKQWFGMLKRSEA